MTRHNTTDTTDDSLPAIDRASDEQVVLFVSGEDSDRMADSKARIQRDVCHHPDSTLAFITADRDLFRPLSEMR